MFPAHNVERRKQTRAAKSCPHFLSDCPAACSRRRAEHFESGRKQTMAGTTHPIPLQRKNLAEFEKRGIRVSKYDPIRLGSSTIIHLSVGGFHRGHQLLYLDDLLTAGKGEKWRSVGVGLLPFDMVARDAMKAQDCLYTLVERDAKGDVPRIIGSMADYFYAPERQEEVLSALTDPTCKIVSMTITEGGYFVKGNGAFDKDNADIQHDLKDPTHPRSSFGYLLAALKRRKDAGILPFTILSCDNIQLNGDVTKTMLLAFARLYDADLAKWLENNGAFPNCMVDRIVPNTSDAHRKLVLEKFGIVDQWPVTGETFRQWVVEDHFPLGRPAWQTVGVQMVNDVVPYELMKIRLLNGPHFLCAVLGVVLGHRFYPQSMGDANVAKVVRREMDEVTPFVPPVPETDLEKYKDKLIERFSNPAVNDQLMRVVADGSSKIPKFILPCVRDALKAGIHPVTYSAFAVATWIFYLGQDVDALRNPLDFNDPRLDQIRDAARRGRNGAAEFLKIKEIFGNDLAENEKFSREVDDALKSFYAKGARSTLDEYAKRT